VYSKSANNMAVSGLSCKEALVGTGRAISVLFGISGLRNKPLTFVELQFPMFKACFLAVPGWHFLKTENA